MRRSFTFLLRPTRHQQISLATCLDDHRQLYNAALEHRRTAYRKAGVTVRYGDQSAELKHIRADDAEGQGRWSFSSRQATLRRLDKAFAAFFTRGAAVGIDMGVASLVTTSDGDPLDNPRHLAAFAGRLAAVQRDLARKKRGSRRRRTAAARVAALDAKVRRQRLDYAHKQALTLVRAYDVIVHEDLRIANMTRSASGTIVQPARNVAAKSGLNRSILDAG
ncbi:RNA-guided endonuclease InsQ/TnpB family protein [Microbispora sitophila]|uniref:RNA-guided endonuclease InsQ/TnpB family protein n=1 Tax=Microbispora sitophila TaxID=2771537 RepID=UPI00299F7885|nr:transposase [Microbispora sitophila]